MPTVSVIILTCNRPEWLREAVASVVAQTWEDWAGVIVDNGYPYLGETPPTYGGRFGYWPCSGASAGTGNPRNEGAKTCPKRDYLLFLDDDDVLCPDALETLLRPLEARPHLSASYGFPYLMSASGERVSGMVGRKPRGGELYLSDLVGDLNMVSPPGCALIRRSAFEAVGGWDETGEVRESVELFQRLLRVGPMACIPREVLGYRQHDGQLSKTRNQMPKQYAATEARLQALLNS